MQVYAIAIGVIAARRNGFRDLFLLFRLVRAGARSIPFGTLFAHVSRRVSVCLALLDGLVVAEVQL